MNLHISGWYFDVGIWIKSGFDQQSMYFKTIKKNVYQFCIGWGEFDECGYYIKDHPRVLLLNELNREVYDKEKIAILYSRYKFEIEAARKKNYKPEGRVAPSEEAFWRNHYSGDYSDMGGF